MEFFDKNAKRRQLYRLFDIGGGDSQKVAHLPNPEGLLEIGIVALSRKFILETAVGLFRISWVCFFHRCEKEKTKYFDISSYTNNRNAGDNFIFGYITDRISNYRNNVTVGIF